MAQLDSDQNARNESLSTWLESNGFVRFRDELEDLDVKTWDDALHLNIQDINDFINEVNTNADANNKVPLKLRVKFKQQFWHKIDEHSKKKAASKDVSVNSSGSQISVAGVIVLTDEQRQVVIKFNEMKKRMSETFLDGNSSSNDTEGTNTIIKNENVNIFKSIDFNKLNQENREKAKQICQNMKEFVANRYSMCDNIEKELMNQSGDGLNLGSSTYDECINKMNSEINCWNEFEQIYIQYERKLKEILIVAKTI